MNWIKWLAVLAAVGSVLWYIKTAEHNRAEVTRLSAELQTSQSQTQQNQAAFDECQAVNESNRAAAAEQERRMQEAVARAAVLRAMADRDIGDIHAQAETIRGTDPTCRTLDDPLPDSFVAGVRKPTR